MPAINTGLTTALFGSPVGFVTLNRARDLKIFQSGMNIFADVEHEPAARAESELHHVAAGRESNFSESE
jgi:hypothetical protein